MASEIDSESKIKVTPRNLQGSFQDLSDNTENIARSNACSVAISTSHAEENSTKSRDSELISAMTVPNSERRKVKFDKDKLSAAYNRFKNIAAENQSGLKRVGSVESVPSVDTLNDLIPPESPRPLEFDVKSNFRQSSKHKSKWFW